jgi:hypothetical protein
MPAAGLAQVEVTARVVPPPVGNNTSAVPTEHSSRQIDSLAGGTSLIGTSVRVRPWEPGWAVRRDWPDGSHEFLRFEASEELARAFVPGDVRYWQRGPVRPRHSVVVISARDFELHHRRDPCRAPDCPQQTPRDPLLPGPGTAIVDRSVR